MFPSEFREILLLQSPDIPLDVLGGLGEEVVGGGEEEEGREEEPRGEDAGACEDGGGEGGDADVEEPGGEGFGWGDEGFEAVWRGFGLASSS